MTVLLPRGQPGVALGVLLRHAVFDQVRDPEPRRSAPPPCSARPPPASARPGRAVPRVVDVDRGAAAATERSRSGRVDAIRWTSSEPQSWPTRSTGPPGPQRLELLDDPVDVGLLGRREVVAAPARRTRAGRRRRSRRRRGRGARRPGPRGARCRGCRGPAARASVLLRSVSRPGRWDGSGGEMSLKQRSSQRPSAQHDQAGDRAVVGVDEGERAAGGGLAQSSPITAPWTTATAVRSGPGLGRRSARSPARTRAPSDSRDSPPGIASQRSSAKTCLMIGSPRAARMRYSPPSNSPRRTSAQVRQHVGSRPVASASGAAVSCVRRSVETKRRGDPSCCEAARDRPRPAPGRRPTAPGRCGRRRAGSCAPATRPRRRRGARG